MTEAEQYREFVLNAAKLKKEQELQNKQEEAETRAIKDSKYVEALKKAQPQDSNGIETSAQKNERMRAEAVKQANSPEAKKREELRVYNEKLKKLIPDSEIDEVTNPDPSEISPDDSIIERIRKRKNVPLNPEDSRPYSTMRNYGR